MLWLLSITFWRDYESILHWRNTQFTENYILIVIVIVKYSVFGPPVKFEKCGLSPFASQP